MPSDILSRIHNWNQAAGEWLRSRPVDQRPPLDLIRQGLGDDERTVAELESIVVHLRAEGRIRATQYLDRFSELVAPLFEALPAGLEQPTLDLLTTDRSPSPEDYPTEWLPLFESAVLIEALRELAQRPGRRS